MDTALRRAAATSSSSSSHRTAACPRTNTTTTAAAATAARAHQRRWQRVRLVRSPVAAAGPGHASGRDGATPAAQEAGLPWGFGFQTSERSLQWSDSAHVQLVKLYVAHKLGLTDEQVEDKLSELGSILPDFVSKLERSRADVVLKLVVDTPGIATRILELKGLLPDVNVSLLGSKAPSILLDYSSEQLREKLEILREQLPGVNIERLLEREPLFLMLDVPKVLSNIKRLMPRADPVALLVSDPHLVLGMEDAGLPSSVEHDIPDLMADGGISK